jgi:hypothetical protein
VIESLKEHHKSLKSLAMIVATIAATQSHKHSMKISQTIANLKEPAKIQF